MWRVPLAYADKAEAEKSEAAFRFNCAQRKFWRVRVPVVVQELTRRPQAPMRIPLRASHTSLQCQWSGLNGQSRVPLHSSHRRAMIWGLKQPVYSATALEIWVLSRVWYTYGYIKNGPKGVRSPDHQKLDLIIHTHPPVSEVCWRNAQRDYSCW